MASNLLPRVSACGPRFAAKAITSQFDPESEGVVTRRFRLEPNDSAAASANRLRAAPNIVVRTGTAVRPRPGSSAIRTPAVALGGNDAWAMNAATADGRRDPRASA